ncbi:MAG: gfo/Idh/MocA family oxidoreductase, partial [Deltaproteobacteria bacterium]|nr:gfo/Idh/MocA family oxidoreductase [Deltaproteobacteria bacterium]
EVKSERIPWWRADISSLVDEFVSAVEQNRSPAITGADARAALEITIAAYRSAATGEPVALPLGN